MAQQLYSLMLKHDTWNLTIVKEPPTMFAGKMGIPIPRAISTVLKIQLEIDTGGESGPTPYVRGEP